MNIGQTIKVRGLSQKGKNRIREHGNVWTIIQISETVRFSSDIGPWLLLRSLNGNSIRWMKETNDKDFNEDAR